MSASSDLDEAAVAAAMLAAQPDPVIVVDASQRIVLFNAAAESVFGCRSADALGTHVERFVPVRLRAAHQQHMLTFASSPGSQPAMRRRELSALRADGTEFPVETCVFRMQVGAAPLHAVVLRDLSDEDPRLAVGSFQARKMEALGTLSRGVAHELNNILFAMRGFIELALDDTADDHPARESLLEIEKAVDRASELIRRVQAFSRLEAPRLEMLQLPPLLAEAVASARADLPRQLEVRTSCAADLPPTVGDASQIRQVLANLVSHVAHGPESGAGPIEVTLAAAEVAPGAIPEMRPGRYLRASVRGANGNARTKAERILDPFRTAQPAEQLMGTTLSVAQGILRVHGGTLTVASEAGSGTILSAYFPAMSAAPAAAAAAAPGGLQKLRLLFVDDDEALVMLITRKLERLGYVVAAVNDAPSALGRYAEDPDAFDAVVTDLTMPDMSGFELAAEVLRLRPQATIIVTSGYVREPDLQRAREIGVRALIRKPATVEELSLQLDQICRGS